MRSKKTVSCCCVHLSEPKLEKGKKIRKLNGHASREEKEIKQLFARTSPKAASLVKPK